jgi:hypothetical protein
MKYLKESILIPVSFLFSLTCFSQEMEVNNPEQGETKEKRFTSSYFSEVIAGISIPSADFAAYDPADPQSGFADLGGFLFAGYGKLYNNILGYEVAISLNLNPINKKIDQYWKTGNPDEYYRGFGWVIINCLVGPHLSFAVSDRFSFNARFLVGIMDAIRPSHKNIYYSDEFLIYKESPGHGYSFVWHYGVGFLFAVSKKVDLKLSADVFRGKPEIRYKMNLTAQGVDYNYCLDFDEIKYKQPISVRNIGFGVLLHLD